jgi:hypothetical protein
MLHLRCRVGAQDVDRNPAQLGIAHWLRFLAVRILERHHKVGIVRFSYHDRWHVEPHD